MKAALSFLAIIMMCTACNRDPIKGPEYSYTCSANVSTFLYHRTDTVYTDDLLRVDNLGPDKADRTFTKHYSDLFMNKDTLEIQKIIREKDVELKLTYPYNLYSYTEDTIGKNTGSYICNRVN